VALSRRIESERGDDLARSWHEADADERAEGAQALVGAEGLEPPTSAL
jgi:hypothetical protein